METVRLTLPVLYSSYWLLAIAVHKSHQGLARVAGAGKGCSSRVLRPPSLGSPLLCGERRQVRHDGPGPGGSCSATSLPLRERDPTCAGGGSYHLPRHIASPPRQAPVRGSSASGIQAYSAPRCGPAVRPLRAALPQLPSIMPWFPARTPPARPHHDRDGSHLARQSQRARVRGCGDVGRPSDHPPLRSRWRCPRAAGVVG